MKEIHEKTKFSFPEIESLLVQFNRRRMNKESNNLNKEDLGRFLAPLGIEVSAENLEKYYASFDPNGDGVSFKELVSSLSTFLRGSPEEVAEIQFKTWDADNNEKLDREEFSALLKSINRSSLTSDDVEALGENLFAELDTDCNGISTPYYLVETIHRKLITV